MSAFHRLQRLRDELDDMQREWADASPEPAQPQTRQERLLADCKARTTQTAMQASRVTNFVLGICVLVILLFVILNWLFGG